MAKCTICNNQFYSKECPHCKKTAWENKININNEIDSSKYKPRKNINTKIKNKSKNIALTVIAVAIAIIAIIMMRNEYIKYQEEKQIAKLLYGTDNYEEIEKINEKIIKELRNIYIPK